MVSLSITQNKFFYYLTRNALYSRGLSILAHVKQQCAINVQFFLQIHVKGSCNVLKGLVLHIFYQTWTVWCSKAQVGVRIASLIPLWQSLSPECVIHQVIYFHRMA